MTDCTFFLLLALDRMWPFSVLSIEFQSLSYENRTGSQMGTGSDFESVNRGKVRTFSLYIGDRQWHRLCVYCRGKVVKLSLSIEKWQRFWVCTLGKSIDCTVSVQWVCSWGTCSDFESFHWRQAVILSLSWGTGSDFESVHGGQAVICSWGTGSDSDFDKNVFPDNKQWR